MKKTLLALAAGAAFLAPAALPAQAASPWMISNWPSSAYRLNVYSDTACKTGRVILSQGDTRSNKKSFKVNAWIRVIDDRGPGNHGGAWSKAYAPNKCYRTPSDVLVRNVLVLSNA